MLFQQLCHKWLPNTWAKDNFPRLNINECEQKACSISKAIIDNVTIDGLKNVGRNGLWFTWAFVFRHATFRGKFISFNINRWVDIGIAKRRKTMRVTKDPKIQKFDEATYARLVESDFQDGILEVQVLSKLLPDAPDYVRGFTGIAFRIDKSNSRFEGIYIRPPNGRSNDQLQRNHSTQYFSYPDFKFDRLRKETPGKYESYADLGLNEWISLKIVVKGEKAMLFINGSDQPMLIVNDLKHGPDFSGGIGLWVDGGTEGFFTSLTVETE